MVLGVNAEARKELSASYNKTVERHDHVSITWLYLFTGFSLLLICLGRRVCVCMCVVVCVLVCVAWFHKKKVLVNICIELHSHEKR